MTKLNPYIHFKNNAREAMEFYHSVFGGKLDLNTFKESNMSSKPEEDNLIMHAMLVTQNDLTLMASDTPSHIEYKPGASITISLSGQNEEELTGYWNKLLEGGKSDMPLTKAPWGDTFGMLVDKFDIEWMVNIEGKKE